MTTDTTMNSGGSTSPETTKTSIHVTSVTKITTESEENTSNGESRTTNLEGVTTEKMSTIFEGIRNENRNVFQPVSKNLTRLIYPTDILQFLRLQVDQE